MQSLLALLLPQPLLWASNLQISPHTHKQQRQQQNAMCLQSLVGLLLPKPLH